MQMFLAALAGVLRSLVRAARACHVGTSQAALAEGATRVYRRSPGDGLASVIYCAGACWNVLAVLASRLPPALGSLGEEQWW